MQKKKGVKSIIWLHKQGWRSTVGKPYKIPMGSYGMCVCSRLCWRTKQQCVCGADRLWELKAAFLYHHSLRNLSQKLNTDQSAAWQDS